MGKYSNKNIGVALIVFAKTLEAPAKTRIARTEGKAVADRIYRELLDATVETIKELPYYVAFSGSALPGPLTSIFGSAISFFPQIGEDLGTRMKNACLHCGGFGFKRFIVIGCDCPDRTAMDILQTAEALKNGYNVVLGPVEDGGYHLAGVDTEGLRIFNATKWSTEQLLKETLAIAHKNKLKVKLLQVRSDIDSIEDYCRWKGRRNIAPAAR